MVTHVTHHCNFQEIGKYLGKCNVTVLEVISGSLTPSMKHHSAFLRSLLKDGHIQISEMTTKKLLR